MLIWSDESLPLRNLIAEGTSGPFGGSTGEGSIVAQPLKRPDATKFELAPFQQRIDKPWGWESIWADNDFYTGKILHVFAGKRLSLQYHDSKIETQCLLHGCATLIVEGADGAMHELPMVIGRGYTLQPYQAHRLVAIEESDIVEVSTAEMGMTVRLEDDFSRGNETEEMRALPDRGWTPDQATET
jgi:hypothetical protein